MVTRKEWTRDTPWRQGHLLPHEAVKSLGLTHPKYPDDTLVIVASHDCDLAQPPDKEPEIELVVGRQIQSLDGNYTHAKSSRILHIEFEGKEPLPAEFVITAKCGIPKNVLADFSPTTDFSLSPADCATFQMWLASRYRRAAFPDEFQRRLTESRLTEKIANAVRPHGKMITAVFFDVDEGEEINRKGPSDVYVLGIYLLHITEPDFNAAEAAAKQAKTIIENAFEANLLDKQTDTWGSIELRYVDVLSENAMTFLQSKLLKKWRLDHISLGADPQQPILTE